jgi:tetratricopeptide (TPR) repeat protein
MKVFTYLVTGKFIEVSWSDSGPQPPPTVGVDVETTAPRKGEAFDKLMDYLDPTPYTKFLETRAKMRLGHNDWYFERKEIKNWLDPQSDESRFLSMQGPMGCGKTVSAAHIIEHCLHVCGSSQSPKDTAMINFFFGDVRDNNNLETSFLTTVIAQLYTQRPQLSVRVPLLRIPLIDGIPRAYLWSTLGNLLRCFKCTYCILDGVDFPKKGAFLHKMEELPFDSNTRILITSRSHLGEQASKSRWIEIDALPLEIVRENIKSYAMSELNCRQSPTPSSANPLSRDIILGNIHDGFYYVIVATKANSELTQSTQDLDGLLGKIFRSLGKHRPYLRNTAFRILEWMTCAPMPLMAAELDELLFMVRAPETRMRATEIIRDCLRGLVDELDSYARFSVPPVRDYIVFGTTDSDRDKKQPIIPLSQARRNIAIEILKYLNSWDFSQYIYQRSFTHGMPNRRTARHTILRPRWLWFVTQAEPDVEIISLMTKFLHSTHCQDWIKDLAREDPCLLLKQLYNVELEKWLQKSQNITESKMTRSHLTRLREIMFQILGLFIVSDTVEFVKTVNCMGQLLISSHFPTAAEELFRRFLGIVPMWRAHPEIVLKHLPFYMLGHTIDGGQLVTLKDICGRAKAVDAQTMANLLVQAQCLSDSNVVRRRILERVVRMRNLARQGLHEDAHVLHQTVKAQLESLRWDNPTIQDTILGLAALLLEQGRSSEVDDVLRDSNFNIEEDGEVILICCSAGKTISQEDRLELVNTRVDGAGRGREATLMIERLGNFYFNAGHQHIARLFFEKALAQREARQENIQDPAMFESFKLLTSAYLSMADFEAALTKLAKIGSLSLSQLRELSSVHKPIGGMNFAIMLQQLGLKDLVAKVVEDLATSLTHGRSKTNESDDIEKEFPSTVITSLAAFLIKQNRAAEAEILLKRVLVDPRDLSQHQLLGVKQNLAAALHRQGLCKDAEILEREIRATSQTLASSTNPGRDEMFLFS